MRLLLLPLLFLSAKITEWIDVDSTGEGQTATCPRCGIDSVLGSASGLPISREFLDEMNRHPIVQRMDRASIRDRLRAHCGAVCEAVLASVACVNDRSQAATKIFSEDRPRAGRLSIVKIALLALSNDHCIPRGRSFPTGKNVSLRVRCLNAKRLLPRRSGTRARSHRCSVCRVNTICTRPGCGVERHAQRTLVPRDLTTRRTRVRARSSGNTETTRDDAARSPSS